MSFQNQDQPDSSHQRGRICIGKISAAHGVKGLVKILPYGENLDLLEQVDEYKITLKNPQGKFMLAEIEGVNDRDAADALRGTELYITRDKLPEIEEDGTYYHEDLVGLIALDENEEEIGKVIAVHNFGAGDLLEIQPKGSSSYLIPFNDEYVPDVRLEKGVILTLRPEE